MSKAAEQGRRGQGRNAAAGLLLALCAFAFSPMTANGAAPQISGVSVSAVTATTATLNAKVNPQGKFTNYRFEYGAEDCEASACTSVPVPEGKIPAGTSPVPVSVVIEGLTPATLYHFRVVAKNIEGEAKSGDRVFATRQSQIFEGLPDDRAYEQASPTNKNGGDAVGEQALVKAADDGSGITFGSTFGIPGAVGAQGLPLYLASRGANWSTQGLFPPPVLGERAVVTGWLPDFSETFTSATKLGNPRSKALFALSTSGKAPVEISPYVAKAEYFYAGASADAATIAFESRSKLPEGEAKTPSPVAITDSSNVYAWDRATKELHLASVFNDGKSLPKGAFAGPYGWSKGTTAASLHEGGSAATYYLQEEHAVSASGDVYFTAVGSGQLYLRRNPTKAQSPLDGEGKCTDSTLACTIHVSATQKTNGEGEKGADPAGPQTAAFQAASADGTKAFFTSSEKLTNDANTGPEQPPATIGIGGIGGGIEDESFIPAHALGVAIDAKYIYWADPTLGAIGRAELADPANTAEPGFIAPGPIECEIEKEPGTFESVAAKPRYVAVDKDHVYWTNTGCISKKDEGPLDGGGTIGRADIDGTPASVEPAFIEGASNPQGIAVNATHIYWANAGRFPSTATIGRADIEGTPASVEQVFFEPGSLVPHGVALSATHVYFTVNTEAESGNASLRRIPLASGKEEFTFISNTAKLLGLAVDDTYVYWAAQGEEAIGRLPIADFPEIGPCENVPSCEKAFVEVEGELNGLAVDAQHLYWSVNGEAPGNPGNDLYRFEADETGGEGSLSDLTVEPDGDGAEVQGVVGAADDGSRVYFVANAVLDEAEEAEPGTCKGAVISTQVGSCNLYLWEEGGGTSFVARLRAGGDSDKTDALNWTGASEGLFGSNSYQAKTAFLTEDGETLLFRSQESLTDYENEGVPQLYRYRLGDPEPLHCVSCPPSGEAAGEASLGSVVFPGMRPLRGGTAAVASRNLSADGNRVFFETTTALVPEDANGQGGCPPSGSDLQQYPACLDVYEWEAPETGTCKATSPAYSPLNGGCLYLISTGKSEFPSLFADASLSGDDVFFFTRQQLVKQDKDQLQDVYDARVGGGIAAQNPPTPPPPCESVEACHEPAPPAPAPQPTPGSATFVGPGNVVGKHKKPKTGKGKKHKKAKAKKHKKANNKRRARR